MSRASPDRYEIPLRSLTGRKQNPTRNYSSFPNSRYDDLEESFTETADDYDDALSVDEAPLIHASQVINLGTAFR